jgi:hypothetical protein
MRTRHARHPIVPLMCLTWRSFSAGSGVPHNFFGNVVCCSPFAFRLIRPRRRLNCLALPTMFMYTLLL